MRRLAAFTCLAVLAFGEPDAHAIRRRQVVTFELETPPVGPSAPSTRGPHAGSHGSTILADAHGLLVAERTVGAVIRAGRDGAAKGRVELHPGLGELVGDGNGLVFVADRAADRVVKLSPGDADGQRLAVIAEAAITEPHGLALTPDGATLLVTSVANQELVAVDVAALSIRWRVPLAPEPRGVAVTSDGKQAVVGFLSSGALAVVDLASAGAKVRWQALNPRDQVDVIEDETVDEEDPRSALVARGAELFRRRGDFMLAHASTPPPLDSCHPEGRADGLSWRLGPSVLQTPMLAGRLTGTAPFKWDGQDGAPPRAGRSAAWCSSSRASTTTRSTPTSR